MLGNLTLVETQERDLIDFIKKLIDNVFLPIFIFTFKDPDSIKEKLQAAGLWYSDKPNRIFVKQKNYVLTDADLFDAIEDWVKAMPSVYVLKEWEKSVSETKNNMFLEMYEYSPFWTKIIWDMLKSDSRENHKEFGDFVTRNLINRINSYSFDETILDVNQVITKDELSKVVEGERYLSYNEQPQQVYTGDLFLQYDPNGNKQYFLNIRAQCDLARNRNPSLYLIKGKELLDKDIATEDIRITKEQELYLSAEKCYPFEQLGTICQDEEQLCDLNTQFKEYRNKAFFSGGDIIGKKSEIIVPCVAGEKFIKFRLDLLIEKYNDIKDNRIGRILPPFITRILQSCSQFIVREGITPIPKDLFSAFNEQ